MLSLPLTAPAVRRLRANADSHDLCTLTLTATHTILGVARRHPGGTCAPSPATACG
ncbi:hypothetical protein ACFPIJ_56450 [Dactylosporangium cerinum]|uniref:Uncharacterized protein n=1 Tax=Dactylosporangium cerinum TaxID=1434730 RepID=A0ABV9WI22_9ACTN